MSTPSMRSVARALARGAVARAPAVGRAAASLARELTRPLPEGDSALAVEVVTDSDEMARLGGPWDALHRASGGRSAFTSWPWLRAWWCEVEHPADAAPHLYVARDGARVLGIAPTYRAGRVLRMLGDTWVGSEHLDLLAAEGDRELVSRALGAAIARDSALDGVELVDLVEGSAIAEGLRAAGLAGARDEVWQTLPYLALPGSADAWEASLSSNMRYTVRRKLKRLVQRHPAARLVRVADEDALGAALDHLFDLHARRWQTKGQAGNFVREDVRAFHRRAAPALLERELLRLYQLDLGAGQVAATLYCLRSGGRELYLQAGMDPAAEELSVGFCIMAQVIARAADDGVREFDFLRGTEGYKTHWAAGERTTRRFTGARPSARGVAWLAAARAAEEARALLKSSIPEPWWAALKARLS